MTGKPQHGVTLIEVLISLLVLSIGLLGIAALHSVGIAQNHSSWLRSQVTHHGYDIADRMRTNRAAALAGDYDLSFPTDPVTCDPDLEPTGTIAQQDLAEWRNMLACTLPSGIGQIERDGTVFNISIRWLDDRRAQDPDEDGMLELSMETEI